MANTLFWLESFTIAALVGVGLYGLVAHKNLFKALIGLNVLSKAVTFSIAIAGYYRNDAAFGQGFMIAVMLVEVVVTAVTLSILVNVYRHTGSLDVQDLELQDQRMDDGPVKAGGK